MLIRDIKRIPKCYSCGSEMKTYYDFDTQKMELECSNKNCTTNRSSGMSRYEILKRKMGDENG